MPSNDARTSLLVAHDWQVAAQTTTYPHDGKAEVMDVYASTSACVRDNSIRFNADKTLAHKEGTLKCAPDVVSPHAGAWHFNADQTELTINDEQLYDADKVYQVLDLTEQTLQIRYTYTYSINGRQYAGIEDYTYTAL